MKPVLADMVWPALYVSTTFYKFWYLVIGTIVIETFVIKYSLKFNWSKSFIISLIGNSVSGIVGTFVMVWAMLFWHLAADNFLNGTFNAINWIATYVFMCVGSVFIETLTIKLIFKIQLKELFLPMLTGNFLSYVFIVYVMLTAPNSHSTVKRTEIRTFIPDKPQLLLYNKTKLQIGSATIKILFDKNGKQIKDTESTGYDFNISFKKSKENDFQFEFRLPEEANSNGIEDTLQTVHIQQLRHEYTILLQQKNPDTSLGWKKPIVSDTIIFKQIITSH